MQKEKWNFKWTNEQNAVAIFLGSFAAATILFTSLWVAVVERLRVSVADSGFDPTKVQVLRRILQEVNGEAVKLDNTIWWISAYFLVIGLFFVRLRFTKRLVICLIAVPVTFSILRVVATLITGESLLAGLIKKIDQIPASVGASTMYVRLQNGLEIYLLPSAIIDFALLVAVFLILMGFRDKTFKSVLGTKVWPARLR